MISRLKYKEGLIGNLEFRIDNGELRMENCGIAVLVVTNEGYKEFNSQLSILNSTLNNGRL